MIDLIRWYELGNIAADEMIYFVQNNDKYIVLNSN